MPITKAELVEKLRSLELKVIEPPDRESEVHILFATERYRNPTDEHSLLIVCRLSEDGGYLEMFAPGVYASRDCKHKGSLFAALLEMSWMTKAVQAEYDPSDGEIRIACDLFVEDGTATPRQLLRMMRSIVGIIEDFDPVIRHVFQTGKIDMSLLPRPTAEAEGPAEMMGLLEELGGIEELRKIVEERRSRREGGPA